MLTLTEHEGLQNHKHDHCGGQQDRQINIQDAHQRVLSVARTVTKGAHEVADCKKGTESEGNHNREGCKSLGGSGERVLFTEGGTGLDGQ